MLASVISHLAARHACLFFLEVFQKWNDFIVSNPTDRNSKKKNKFFSQFTKNLKTVYTAQCIFIFNHKKLKLYLATQWLYFVLQKEQLHFNVILYLGEKKKNKNKN